ncbi:lysine--tRNA ligase [Sphingoaurantiacus capsulatus]|uniref:Lysine--tRNA ligase n=1 Tax=Sphingoaurantiacus capsulatus TaxID=1771310 RepID=A0ABV7X8L4_9SPHN
MSNIEELRAAALTSKAWPFEEARKVVARGIEGRPAVFETGYGPSGLPHIGTFQEVARTTYVRRAYELLTGGAPTRLIAFSDDMDGLRKVPDNLPGGDMLRANLGKPLTRIPDPFGKFESFAHHNNAMLRDFLDRFGFDYEFLSATDCYTSGRFDPTLLQILANYDAVIDVILPTLGPERRATYAPFLPVCPKTGVVLQVPLIERDAAAGTVTYLDPNDGERMTVKVTGGAVKCQWKVDWAMRWLALGVDYEMAGKDLIDSVTLSSRIVRILGAKPPEGFNYELFLDANGEKISKSRGNGLTIEEWLTYASPESLAFYIYREPRKAKKLSFDVIPKSVDEYYQFLGNFADQPPEQKLGNPVFHIHEGKPVPVELPVNFALLLNLVAVAGTGVQDSAGLWKYLSRYVAGATPETHPELDRLVQYAVRYGSDFVVPTLQRRAPVDLEAQALADLDARLQALPDDADAEAIQFEVYECGKAAGFDNLRDWFKALYETLLGSSQGPRMGSFIALYGIANTRRLIAEALGAVRH